MKLGVLHRSHQRHLFVIFIIALGLRLAFVFVIQEYLFGEPRFEGRDTWSYTNAFLNLLNTGSYTFDPTHPDASFFRPPGYPFYWGIHYLIFGSQSVFQAVAVSQSFLDAGSAVLIYLIAAKLGARPIFALLGALTFAVNPFQIIWVPISQTEIFATFLSLVIVLMIVGGRPTTGRVVLVGFMVGVSVLTRQYLGIFIAISLVWIVISYQFSVSRSLVPAATLLLAFATTLSPWVIRNWVYHGYPYVLKGETRGYYDYGPDAVAFERVFNRLDENITPYLDDTARLGTVDLDGLDLHPNMKADLERAVSLAHKCGPSFLYYRGDRSFTFLTRDQECERRLIDLFDKISFDYKASVSFFKYNKTRLDAFTKAIFKNKIYQYKFSNTNLNTLITILFGVRSAVVMVAFISLFFIYRHSIIVALYPVFMYVYIPIVNIHTEIRYLMQADALLLVLFSLSVDRCSRYISDSRSKAA